MATKKQAQKEARGLRKKYPEKTVNVVEITKGNWGCRFSSKGKRDKLKSTRTAAGGHDQKSRRKYDRGGRVEAYTFGETQSKRNRSWPF